MGFIKNYDQLAKTPQRKVVLDLIEAGLAAIQPEKVLENELAFTNNTLRVKNRDFNLEEYENIYLLGIGKGSAHICKIIETLLGERLNGGYVIDGIQENFNKIELTIGTHPLPSEANLNFTNKVIEKLGRLTDKDLVIFIICGGGSAMFVSPQDGVTLDDKIKIGKELLRSGATIEEMNVVRKHLSKVKGGGLAKIIYPAHIVGLIFSDVPGNDLSTIASGPITKDPSTVEQAKEIIKKYNLDATIAEKFVEPPKDDKYFEHISTFLMLSNATAIEAMSEKAKSLGIPCRTYSDKFQSDVEDAGQKLLVEAQKGEILLAGGETTVHVTGSGVGGRNLEVVLASLKTIEEGTVITSFDSDGWDNCPAAGGIGDTLTKQEAQKQNLDANQYLKEDNSLDFFQKTGDSIMTGRLPSNVSDLYIVYKS